MGDVSDRLEVKVVAARGLGEVEGGDCNPFALVRCGAEEERTAVASATSSAPAWNASTMIFTDVADAADDVVVAVMHKALSAARDQALGRAVISLRTCFQAVGVEQDDWFPLEDADGRACGEVRLELAYFVDADAGLSPASQQGSVKARYSSFHFWCRFRISRSFSAIIWRCM